MSEQTPMIDRFRRPLRDLRISITDRCNLRCTYCMPHDIYNAHYTFLPTEDQLSVEEFHRLVKLFTVLGVRKIRITGGEPLLHREIDQLVSCLSTLPEIKDVALTTNGLLLHKYAERLVNAGLMRINVSLDALDKAKLLEMNGRAVDPDRILANIAFAQQCGLQIKVNMVVIKGINEDQIMPMAQYFKDHDITLRFIEFMDVGNENRWNISKVMTKQDIIHKLSEHHDLEPVSQDEYGAVAKYYRYKGSDTRVGFITSVSESFCSTCTRARISSDGKLFTCLFASEGFDLRELLRSNCTDEEITSAIEQVWQLRSDRYSDERFERTSGQRKIAMSYIGG